jgi:hypothetical protein
MGIRFAQSGDRGSALAKELVGLRPEVLVRDQREMPKCRDGVTRYLS